MITKTELKIRYAANEKIDEEISELIKKHLGVRSRLLSVLGSETELANQNLQVKKLGEVTGKIKLLYSRQQQIREEGNEIVVEMVKAGSRNPFSNSLMEEEEKKVALSHTYLGTLIEEVYVERM